MPGAHSSIAAGTDGIEASICILPAGKELGPDVLGIAEDIFPAHMMCFGALGRESVTIHGDERHLAAERSGQLELYRRSRR